MARMFPASHVVPAPAPPPLAQSPGPRPRPVGGDDTPPGCTPDSGANTDKENSDLVIGSWDEECEKDNATGAVVVIVKSFACNHRVFWWSCRWN